MSLDTNISQVNQNMALEGQHSAVLAYLGQLALSRPSLPDMLTDAITLIAHVLPADFVWLWEPDSDGKQWTLSSNSRWKQAAAVGTQHVLEPDSLEKLVLRSPYPILVHELKADTRFKPSDVLQTSGATSGLAALVGTVQKPLGIIEAFSLLDHTYSQNDIHFFHSVANILAFFMDAKRQESLWAEMEKDLRKQVWKAQSTPQPDPLERDLHEIKNRLVESRERERLRLAQELHDNPIQDLYGLMYQMDDLREILKNTSGMQILEEFNSTIHRVVNSLRATCGELRPPSLSPFGLEVATYPLRYLIETSRSSS